MPPPSLPHGDKPRSSLARKVILFGVLCLLLVFGLPLGWFVKFRVGIAAAIKRLEAEARAKGEPLTLQELAAMQPKVADEENAAIPLLTLWREEQPEYWDAFIRGEQNLGEWKKPRYPRALPILGADSPDFARTNRLSPEQLEAAESHLAERAAHMAAVQDAIRRPKCQFPVQLLHGLHAQQPHLSVIGEEASHFWLAALVDIERNRIEEAIVSLESTAGLGHLLARDQTILGQLVRSSCYNKAINGMRMLLSRTQLTAGQLDQLAALLNPQKMTTDLKRALIGERCMWLNVFYHPGSLAGATPSTDAELMTGQISSIVQAIGIRGADERLMLETISEAIRLAETDSFFVDDRYAQLFEQAEQKLDEFPPKILTSLALTGLSAPAARFGTFASFRWAAVTALAVERFRLREGRLPETLADLPRDLSAQTQNDPFGGQPLRYRRLSLGYVVYSVGPDRVDDGGRERPRRGNRDQPYDVTFAVER